MTIERSLRHLSPPALDRTEGALSDVGRATERPPRGLRRPCLKKGSSYGVSHAPWVVQTHAMVLGLPKPRRGVHRDAMASVQVQPGWSVRSGLPPLDGGLHDTPLMCSSARRSWQLRSGSSEHRATRHRLRLWPARPKPKNGHRTIAMTTAIGSSGQRKLPEVDVTWGSSAASRRFMLGWARAWGAEHTPFLAWVNLS